MSEVDIRRCLQQKCVSNKTFSEREDLLQVEAVRDVICSHERSQQMGDGTSLTTVRPEQEGVHAPLPAHQSTELLCSFSEVVKGRQITPK